MTLFLYLQFGQVVELNPDKHLQSTTHKTAKELKETQLIAERAIVD